MQQIGGQQAPVLISQFRVEGVNGGIYRKLAQRSRRDIVCGARGQVDGRQLEHKLAPLGVRGDAGSRQRSPGER